jgi:hypothetical protein
MTEPPGTYDLAFSAPVRRKYCLWGIASLCVGLCTLWMPFAMCFFPPVVVTLGVISLARISQERETLKGYWIAGTGTALGLVELFAFDLMRNRLLEIIVNVSRLWSGN